MAPSDTKDDDLAAALAEASADAGAAPTPSAATDPDSDAMAAEWEAMLGGGDEDGGGMSAFVVFSMMGFYPVTAGVPIYDLGSPVFSRVTIHLKNGKKIEIIAQDCSAQNKSIQSIKLNGRPLNHVWFRHAEIANGGPLEWAWSRNRCRQVRSILIRAVWRCLEAQRQDACNRRCFEKWNPPCFAPGSVKRSNLLLLPVNGRITSVNIMSPRKSRRPAASAVRERRRDCQGVNPFEF